MTMASSTNFPSVFGGIAAQAQLTFSHKVVRNGFQHSNYLLNFFLMYLKWVS